MQDAQSDATPEEREAAKADFYRFWRQQMTAYVRAQDASAILFTLGPFAALAVGLLWGWAGLGGFAVIFIVILSLILR